MDGILPVYKPAGITSYDCVWQVKRLLPSKQTIGHAGTLDPFADGVLLLMLGSSTKRFDEIQTWKKTYRAVAKLGWKSDTLDVTGRLEQGPSGTVSQQRIELTVEQFIGTIMQEIPAYSAAKVAGQPRYKYARRGEVVATKSKPVTIYSIEVLHFDYSNNRSQAELLIQCGSGTYIRQLSYDIFKKIGIESYLERLTREAIGEITRAKCFTLDQLTDEDKIRQLLLPAHGG